MASSTPCTAVSRVTGAGAGWPHVWRAQRRSPGYLAYVFALHRRVRPYYSDLVWDLERHPLGEPVWAAVQQLLVELERLARRAGHGGVLDSWSKDLVLMRGHEEGGPENA